MIFIGLVKMKMKNEIVITYGKDARKMTKDVLRRAKLEEMIPKGARIGIKPNLVVAKPASTGATTSPTIVEALIEYLQEHGHQNITILEGSWVGDSTKRAFRTCGYEDISQKYGVPLFDTKGDTYTKKTFSGIAMEISNKALELDFLINMPVLKGHCQTMVTGALKNMKGIISDNEKRRFHTMGLHKPIAYLNKVIGSQFILVDGLCGDLDFEEGGNPVQMNRIFCGTDPVLIDSYIASTMGYSPTDIDYIKIAADIGIGSCNLEDAEIVVLEKDTTIARPTASRKVQHLAGYTCPKDACSACYANLIQALARLDDQGALKGFKNNPIKIGQGYKNQKEEGIGVGLCTADISNTVKGCPPSTPAILDFLEQCAMGKRSK